MALADPAEANTQDPATRRLHTEKLCTWYVADEGVLALAAPADVAVSYPPEAHVVIFKCFRLLQGLQQQPGHSNEYRCESVILGEGTFGQVRSGVHVSTGTAVALKMFKACSSAKARADILQEAVVLRELSRSPFVVKLLDFTCLNDSISLVFERQLPG